MICPIADFIEWLPRRQEGIMLTFFFEFHYIWFWAKDSFFDDRRTVYGAAALVRAPHLHGNMFMENWVYFSHNMESFFYLPGLTLQKQLFLKCIKHYTYYYLSNLKYVHIVSGVITESTKLLVSYIKLQGNYTNYLNSFLIFLYNIKYCNLNVTNRPTAAAKSDRP